MASLNHIMHARGDIQETTPMRLGWEKFQEPVITLAILFAIALLSEKAVVYKKNENTG
jgi:hypothetical protein